MKNKNIFLFLLTIIMVFAGCEEQYTIGEFNVDEALTPAPRTDTPASVTGVEITSSCSEVIIEWDTIPRAASYDIYADEMLLVEGLTETKYVYVPEHNDLVDYKIVSTNTHGDAESVSGTGQLFGTPAMVSNFNASDEEYATKIVLTWDADYNATGYRIEVEGEVIADVTETEYTDNDVTIYAKTYSVIAYSTCGEAEAAVDDGIITQAPPPVTPGNFIATNDNPFFVELTWDPVADVQFYKILVDGVIIADQLTETKYIDAEGTVSPKEYSLVAYSPFGEADATTSMGSQPLNLLKNGDFEDEFPGGWNTWGNEAVGNDVIDVYRGDVCGRIYNKKGSFMQKDIVLEAGEVYIFRYTYKWNTDAATNTTVGSYTPSDGTIVSWDLKSTTEWTTEEVELTALATGTYKFNFFKNDGNMSSDLFMDDIAVFKKADDK